MTAVDPSALARDLADVRDALDARMAEHRRDLEALVRIPSVSAPGFDPEPVARSAEAVRDLLAARGLQVRLLTDARVHPTVYGELRAADPDAPTVLLYAHHDVQPTGDPRRWTTPPFEPSERDGRLYGRGAADDKAGVLVHVAAISAWLDARGALPVTVKVVVEGEEETANPHLDEFLDRHADLLQADALVITDSVNWKVGVPALTTTLRGTVQCDVEVAALDHAVHSGLYGGAVADPVLGLVRMLAGLVDADGAVAIPGFADDAPPIDAATRARLDALDLDEARFRADAGVLDGVALVGDPRASVPERLWLR
ncbi:MAG TPA: M20/M25/M40 family metallo-hydrolase, partial [Egibacteraceae bacterium]